MAVHQVTVIIYWFLIIKCDYQTVSGTWSLELSGTSQQFMQCHELSGTWSLELSGTSQQFMQCHELSDTRSLELSGTSQQFMQCHELTGTRSLELSGTPQQFMQCHELSGTRSLEHSQSIRHISEIHKLSGTWTVRHLNCQALELSVEVLNTRSLSGISQQFKNSDNQAVAAAHVESALSRSLDNVGTRIRTKVSRLQVL